MATCYDCIHCDRCNDIEGGFSCHCSDVNKCKHFKDKKDYVEVKRGEWVLDSMLMREDGDTYDYCCSVCGKEAHTGEYGNNDVLSDFCPSCGADMRVWKSQTSTGEEKYND